MPKAFFKRFGVRVTAAIVLSILVTVCLSSLLIYQMTFQAQFQELRSRLKTLAHTIALNIDVDQLAQIPLAPEGVDTPAYATVRGYFKKIHAANPRITAIYILKRVDGSDTWQFVVDDDEQNYLAAALPGAPYRAGRFAQMLKGFDAPSADIKMEQDEWGRTLSGYAPVRDAQGRPIGVLGVDVDAQDIYLMKQRVLRQTGIVLLVGIFLALIMGALISGRVTQPVQQLIAGARIIGRGDLQYRVSVGGDDEITQLAESFNEMASGLAASRQREQDHFFDTVKSMVKILEFRDHYTLGHSESVAAYSQRIAERMGIDARTREVFHKVCLLHDIGKVGVRDSVLLKPDKLTDEEWQAIKLHPVLGEQILRSILQDATMLAVIRNHHERYDGNGYPDGWKAGQIPLLVAIATVADSYDAMTSTRAYRKAMSREQAVDQLLKGRGSQFHPEVVDAFLSVL